LAARIAVVVLTRYAAKVTALIGSNGLRPAA
jgi:hypothetical protein